MCVCVCVCVCVFMFKFKITLLGQFVVQQIVYKTHTITSLNNQQIVVNIKNKKGYIELYIIQSSLHNLEVDWLRVRKS